MTRHWVKRFTESERIYHWAQAVPYLVLAVTGVLLFLRRATGVHTFSENSLAVIHRLGAICLLVLIYSAFIASDKKLLLSNLLDAFKWGPKDIRWMWRSTRRLIRPSVELPPVGKFNAGQKLNMIAVLVTVTGLVVSGLVMWTVRGVLLAWYVHVACFLMAFPLILGHMYLAMVHHETRHSLRGMLTGYVDAEWASHHHKEWFHEQHQKELVPPKKSSLKRKVGVSGVLLLTIAAPCAAVWLAIDRGEWKDTVREIAAQPTLLASPGVLGALHQSDPKARVCSACHSLGRGVPDKKCISCHEEISDRIAIPAGYHGDLTGECIECHTEHSGLNAAITTFDRSAFNHNRAQFPLEGAHRKTRCEGCHLKLDKKVNLVRIDFIGPEYDKCTKCHADPHEKQMRASCETCHIANGWKGNHLIFDHERDSEYHLDPLHSDLKCNTCHDGKPPRYSPLAKECVGCHKNEVAMMEGTDGEHLSRMSPHYGLVTCEKCHDPSQRSGTTASYEAACVRCHNEYYGPLFLDWIAAVTTRARAADRAVTQSEEIGLLSHDAAAALHEQVEHLRHSAPHNFIGAMNTLSEILSRAALDTSQGSPSRD